MTTSDIFKVVLMNQASESPVGKPSPEIDHQADEDETEFESFINPIIFAGSDHFHESDWAIMERIVILQFPPDQPAP